MADYGFTTGELLDGKYKIEKLLGQGGMGAVYRAIHLGTKRTVAVKVIHPQFSVKEEFIERFRREAEAAGRLRHPNVVDVTDFGFAATSAGRVAYLVMEYLDGCTLGEILDEEKKLPPAWVVDILEQVCSAVGEAHRLGIIHRDLKPDNIWLEPNRRGGYTVKVLDFGLVKMDFAKSAELKGSPDNFTARSGLKTDENIHVPTLIQPAATAEGATQIQASAESLKVSEDPEENELLNSETLTLDQVNTIKKDLLPVSDKQTGGLKTIELTQVGSIMGTPLYMSPEQCRGEQLDAGSDIYSLGVIAYQMFAGETPFSGAPLELLKMHEKNAPPPLREKTSNISKRTASLVMAALAKERRARPESAPGFADALRSSLEGTGTLLRRAVSLYSEQFPTFLKISLVGYTPLILIIGLINLSGFFFSETTPPLIIGFVGIAFFIAMLISHILAYFSVAALTVPIVVQQIIAPLRPVSLKTAFAALKKRWKTFSLTSLLITLMILFGTLLFIVPGAVAAVFYALSPPVAVMETLNVRATLKRARKLMTRAWSTVLIITILQFVVPFLLSHASIDYTFTFELYDDYSPKTLGFSFSTSGRAALYQLLYIFVTPLTAILTGLLYLKTRQAGGESLKDAVEHFDNLELPESRWQTQMRNLSKVESQES